MFDRVGVSVSAVEATGCAARVNGPRVYDLFVDGSELDVLRSDLPGSAKEWVRGSLDENGQPPARRRAPPRPADGELLLAPQGLEDPHRHARGLVDGLSRHQPLTVRESARRAPDVRQPPARSGSPRPRSRDRPALPERATTKGSVHPGGAGRRIARAPTRADAGRHLLRRVVRPRRADDVGRRPVLEPVPLAQEGGPQLLRGRASPSPDRVHRPGGFRGARVAPAPVPRSSTRDTFVDYFAVLTLQGDQHVDQSHNHKLLLHPDQRGVSNRCSGIR